jgi:serine/threonine protein kinase
MLPNFGFNYTDDNARRSEFALAEKYFADNPDQVKISRKLWKKLYFRNRPKHSYLRGKDGKVFAIAHGPGSDIAKGSQGRVKYAMDKSGIKYALKISTSDDNAQLNLEESITQDVGILHGNKITRTDKPKSYTIQRYLGEDLFEYYNRESKKFTLADKFSIARKTVWELHKLHTGQSSSGNIPYAHLDLKVENIVIAKNGRIRLIDYGFAEKIDLSVSVKYQGTPSQLPMSKNDFEKLKKAKKNMGKDQALLKEAISIETKVKKNMQSLGRVGCDIFALKRTFYNPIPGSRGIFSKNEYAAFAESFGNFRKLIASDSDADIQYTQENLEKHTTMAITFALIQMQMRQHGYHFPADLDGSQKESVCSFFALLDEVNECTEDKPSLSADKLLEWQGKITRSNPAEYANLLNELSLLECEVLLSQINLYAVGGDDKEMKQFIETMQARLQEANPDLQAIKNTLKEALTSVRSDEMRAVREQMDRLFTNAKNFFTWDKKGMLQKAEGIEKALQAVPIMERLNVFRLNSPQCHAVRKALASNRLANRGKEIIPEDQIDNDKAANAFKLLKTRFTGMVEIGKPAPTATNDEPQNLNPQD